MLVASVIGQSKVHRLDVYSDTNCLKKNLEDKSRNLVANTTDSNITAGLVFIALTEIHINFSRPSVQPTTNGYHQWLSINLFDIRKA